MSDTQPHTPIYVNGIYRRTLGGRVIYASITAAEKASPADTDFTMGLMRTPRDNWGYLEYGTADLDVWEYVGGGYNPYRGERGWHGQAAATPVVISGQPSKEGIDPLAEA